MRQSTYLMALVAIASFLFIINLWLYASDMDNQVEAAAKQTHVFRTYLNGEDINIQNSDGVVTLSGSVSKEEFKILAQETVASLGNVKTVINKLSVNREIPAANTDSWIIAKAKSTLLFHKNVNAVDTEIISINGKVTLRGEASSEAEKALTAEYIKDVDGVKSINNEMTISRDKMVSGGKTIGQRVDELNDTIDDASITALVKMTLLTHRSTSALNTTVETKGGVVTLGGQARNAAEKDLASKLVDDVYGVIRVINFMSVESIPPKASHNYQPHSVFTAKQAY